MLNAVVLALGTITLLLRQPGLASWRSVYGEDMPVYLMEALADPWRNLAMGYAGYLQLVPRMIGQLAALVPLSDAAAVFGIGGALIASGCALFVFHASSGHVRSPVLRALLGLSVLLLPVAPLEIINSGTNTPWYLEIALFWALLWRPRSASGAVLAAVIGFAAASSNVTAIVFVIMVAARVIALPRLREQAVSLGWAAGCLVQVPFIVLSGTSRLGGRLATIGVTTSFYGHSVVLPALGWHFSWLLRDMVGRNYALIVVGGVLAVAVGLILARGTWRVRTFTVASLVLSFLFTIFSTTITWWVPIKPVTSVEEAGARYTCLPIFLITGVLIVAAAALTAGQARRAATKVSLVLITVLCIGWIPDFRFTNYRDYPQPWAPVVAEYLQTCQTHSFVTYMDAYDNHTVLRIPCSRIRRLPWRP